MKQVILYEPHSFNYEHELFNSGIIDLFSDDTFIYLLSSENHYNSIKYMFNKNNIKHIKIQPSILKLRFKTIYNYIINFIIISRILRNNKNISEIYILSTWGLIIFIAKIFYWCIHRRNIYFVIHGVLEDILNFKKKSIIFRINIFNNIWKCISILHSKDFKYFVLSPHILDNLKKIKTSKVLNSFFSLIHPTPKSDTKILIKSETILRIGVLGKINLEDLYELDRNLINHDIKIIVYSGDNISDMTFENVFFKSKTFSREFVLKENLNFILCLDFDRNFHLSCSGTYFESCYFNIPVLAASNELTKSMTDIDINLGAHFESIESFYNFFNSNSIPELIKFCELHEKIIHSAKSLIYNFNYKIINNA